MPFLHRDARPPSPSAAGQVGQGCNRLTDLVYTRQRWADSTQPPPVANALEGNAGRFENCTLLFHGPVRHKEPTLPDRWISEETRQLTTTMWPRHNPPYSVGLMDFSFQSSKSSNWHSLEP